MDINWQLLWTMGGHGPYVWASYGIAMLLLVGEAAMLWASRGRDRERGVAMRVAGAEKERA